MTPIPFKHLNSTPLDFEVCVDKTLFKGTLTHKKGKIGQLNGTITGTISLPCDICADDIEKTLNEEVFFYISDGIASENENDIDIVEITTPMINIEEILNSELELIRSDYFCCTKCENKEVNQEY